MGVEFGEGDQVDLLQPKLRGLFGSARRAHKSTGFIWSSVVLPATSNCAPFCKQRLAEKLAQQITMISMFVEWVQSFVAKLFIHERSEVHSLYSPFGRVSLIWILFWYSLCPWHFLNTFLPLFLHRRHLYLLWIGHVYRLRCRWPQRSAGPGENQITEWARGVSHWASWKKSMNIYQSTTSWCFQICEF